MKPHTIRKTAGLAAALALFAVCSGCGAKIKYLQIDMQKHLHLYAACLQTYTQQQADCGTAGAFPLRAAAYNTVLGIAAGTAGIWLQCRHTARVRRDAAGCCL